VFINFIKENVIPQITLHSGPKSVLIMDNAKIYHYLIRFQDYKLLLLTILHRMFKQYVKMLKLNSFICCHIPQTLTLSKKHLYN